MTSLRWSVALASLGLALSAQAQYSICSPSFVDLGAIQTDSTVATTACTPGSAAPGSGGPSVVFAFELAAPGSLVARVSGTNVFGNPIQPVYSGLGISLASLFYGDRLVTSASGGGIGGTERPASLFPSFVSSFADAQGRLPAGDYQVRVFGRSFGPVTQGRIALSIEGGAPNDVPVTAVPEPQIGAMQGLAGLLLAGLWIRERRRHGRRAVP